MAFEVALCHVTVASTGCSTCDPILRIAPPSSTHKLSKELDWEFMTTLTPDPPAVAALHRLEDVLVKELKSSLDHIFDINTHISLDQMKAATQKSTVFLLNLKLSAGKLDDKHPIYIKQVPGFEDPSRPHVVHDLCRSIYGLRQAGRKWNETFISKLKALGFTQSRADPSLFVHWRGDKVAIVPIHVDDGSISLHQRHYVEKLFERFKFVDNVKKNTETPASLTADIKPLQPGEAVVHERYREMLGALLYLAICTRPDLSYAVSVASRFAAAPAMRHWVQLKRILRYAAQTRSHSLVFSPTGSSRLTGFTDADHAADPHTRRSISGWVFTLAGAAIDWQSKRQSVTAISSTEAEYYAFSSAVKEAVWLWSLFHDISFPQEGLTLLRADNRSMILLADHLTSYHRTKHFAVHASFSREKVASGEVQIEWIPMNDLPADMLTKALASAKHCRFSSMLGLTDCHIEGKWLYDSIENGVFKDDILDEAKALAYLRYSAQRPLMQTNGQKKDSNATLSPSSIKKIVTMLGRVRAAQVNAATCDGINLDLQRPLPSMRSKRAMAGDENRSSARSAPCSRRSTPSSLGNRVLRERTNNATAAQEPPAPPAKCHKAVHNSAVASSGFYAANKRTKNATGVAAALSVHRKRHRSLSRSPDIRTPPTEQPHPVPPPPPPPPARLPCEGHYLPMGQLVDAECLARSWFRRDQKLLKCLVIEPDGVHLFASGCSATAHDAPGWTSKMCVECFKLNSNACVTSWNSALHGIPARARQGGRDWTWRELSEAYTEKHTQASKMKLEILNLVDKIKRRDHQLEHARRLRHEVARSTFPRIGTLFEVEEGASFEKVANRMWRINNGLDTVYSYTPRDYKLGFTLCSLGSNMVCDVFNRVGIVPSTPSVRRFFGRDALIASPSYPLAFEVLSNCWVHFKRLIEEGIKSPHQLWSLGQDEGYLNGRVEIDRSTRRILGLDREQMDAMDASVSIEAVEALAAAQEKGELSTASKASVWGISRLGVREGTAVRVVAVSASNASVKISLERDVQTLLLVQACVRFFLQKYELGILNSIAMDGEARGRSTMQETLSNLDLRDELPPDAAERLMGLFGFDYACGEGGTVQCHDPRHCKKRGCTSYTHSKGVELNHVKIVPATLANIIRERHDDLTVDQVTQIIVYDDKQSVNRATNSHYHLYPCADPNPPPFSRFPAGDLVSVPQRCLIALLALIWGGMSDGFGNPSLSLGERCDQIILSQILLSWAH
ncbi:hypothetical protein JCM1840_001402, partial [Sporobolomyces johnsonii]